MTKAMMVINDNGDIMYDCLNHSGDHDVCTIMSTLSNVLVQACFRAGHEPTIYNKGHVRIDLFKADYPTIEVFRTVDAVIRKAAEQNPDYIRIY